MKRKHALAVALVLGMGCTSAYSDTISFEDLLNGGSITAGDKIFSDFEVTFVDSFGAPLPDYALINVVGLDDGEYDPGPGLRFDFNQQLTVAGITNSPGDPSFELLETIDLTFEFTVLVPADTPIKDVSLSLVGELVAPQLDLGMFVLEEVFDPDENLLAEMTAELSFLAPDSNVESLTDGADFAPFQSVRVSKNIFVGASLDGEIARVISIEQRFSQVEPPPDVPLPATPLLLAFGLAGLAVARRRVHA